MPYLLFLNSDAVVRPGAVAALLAALDSDPRAAAAGPRLTHPGRFAPASIRRLPTPWRIFCESSGLAFLSGGREPFAGHAATRQDHAVARRVEALMGAALLVRRSAFEEVGGFDEGFFLYAEETDLMARWRARGWGSCTSPRPRSCTRAAAPAGDRLFGQLHASLVHYARKHHGAAARASGGRGRSTAARRCVMWRRCSRRASGAASRRARYRAALSRPGAR